MKYIVAGSDCDKCAYSTVFEDDKGRLKVYCEYKNREYYYGSRIPCEDFKKDD